MADFEQKLKNCYEYDPIEPREGFIEELKTLENSQAARKRRGGFLLPIAAAAAIALLVFGWVWLHGAPSGNPKGPDVVQAEPGHSLAADEQKKPETPPRQTVTPPAEPETKTPEAQDPEDAEENEDPAPEPETAPKAEAPAPAKAADPKPAAQNPAGTGNPGQDKPEEQTPDEQPDQNPDTPDDPKLDEPENPNRDEPDDPNPDVPDPAEDPPSPEPPAEPEIGAVYQMEDGRETLTLTVMSTGESVELDVTGWEEQTAPAPDEPPVHATYSGSNPIVNFIFEKTIIYYLTRDDDGAVRVDLDVADTDDGATEKGENP